MGRGVGNERGGAMIPSKRNLIARIDRAILKIGLAALVILAAWQHETFALATFGLALVARQVSEEL